ncbi:MAG: type II toxin-antitoxin system PemK/MazF family toxin [Nitrospirota bacterium]
MICEPWDIIVVPFPFTERTGSKHRPALVLSQKPFNDDGHSILAMITTKVHLPWPGDTVLEAYSKAGLRTPCIVRLKLFTLDNRLIVKKIGCLSREDRTKVSAQFHRHIL